MSDLSFYSVDDESLVRQLLKRSVDWDSLGVSFAGESGDAESAMMEIAAMERKPDILFADICMPVVDGLLLSEQIKTRYPEMKVVILTGHGDLGAARRGIRAGVSEFLLKPIQPDEVSEAVLRLKEEILREKAVRKEMERMRGKTQSRNPSEEHRDTMILKVQNYLKDNLNSPDLTQESTAKACNICPAYLSRKFKKVTGRKFSEYLAELRIARAVELIDSTDLLNYEIGERIGIEDPHYFSIFFKKHMGQSIRQYRKK